MAEGTHLTGMVFNLGSGIGRGPKIWAGSITLADADTLDTGLDTIEGCAFTPVDTAVTASVTSMLIFVDGIAGGVITFQMAELDGSDDDAVAEVAWGVVVGSKR